MGQRKEEKIAGENTSPWFTVEVDVPRTSPTSNRPRCQLHHESIQLIAGFSETDLSISDRTLQIDMMIFAEFCQISDIV